MLSRSRPTGTHPREHFLRSDPTRRRPSASPPSPAGASRLRARYAAERHDPSPIRFAGPRLRSPRGTPLLSPVRTVRIAAFVSPHGFGTRRAPAPCSGAVEIARGGAPSLAPGGPEVPTPDTALEVISTPLFPPGSSPSPCAAFTRHELACDLGLVQRSALDEIPPRRRALADFCQARKLRSPVAELSARGTRLVLCDMSARLARGASLGGRRASVGVDLRRLPRRRAASPRSGAFHRELARATCRFRAELPCGEAPGTAMARSRAVRARTEQRCAPPGRPRGQPLVLVTMGGIPACPESLASAPAERSEIRGRALYVVPGGAEQERRGDLVLLPHHCRSTTPTRGRRRCRGRQARLLHGGRGRTGQPASPTCRARARSRRCSPPGSARGCRRSSSRRRRSATAAGRGVCRSCPPGPADRRRRRGERRPRPLRPAG
jgi:hypothetical protein